MAHLISDLILVQDALLKTTDPDESWSMRSHGVTSHNVVDSTEVLIDKGESLNWIIMKRMTKLAL